MNTFTPQIPLSSGLQGLPAREKALTPRDVGDRLFQNLLQKLHKGQDAAESGLPGLPCLGIETPGEGGTASSGVSGRSFLGRMGRASSGLVFPESALPQLRGLLEEQGLSTGQIDRLLVSLTPQGGGIRMDRLLAKLSGFLQQTSDSGSNLVVEAAHIPHVQNALFKMGLGVEEVQKVMETALNDKGTLGLGRLTTALKDIFTDVGPGTESRLAALFRETLGIPLRPESTDQIARQAGIDSVLDRIAQGAPEGARGSAKREIAALLQEKGLPAEEVKRFLETLSIRTESRAQQAEVWKGVRAFDSEGKADKTFANVQSHSDGAHGLRPAWKEDILEILKRENLLGNRASQAPGKEGGGVLGRDLAEVLKQALSSGRTPGGESAKAGPAPFLHTAAHGRNAAASNPVGSGPASSNSPGTGSATTPSGVEFPVPGIDRAGSSQNAAPMRNPAPAAPLPEPLPKVVDRMVWMVRAGEQTSRLQIHPPELGRLDLDLVIRQGHVSAHLNAENPMVKEIIEANLQQLRQQLNNLGLTVERFEVHAGLDDQRFADGHGPAGGRNGRKGPGARPSGGAGDAAAVDPMSPRPESVHSLYRIDVVA